VLGTDLGVIDLTEGSAEPATLDFEDNCGRGLQRDDFSDSGDSVFSNLSSLPLASPRSPSSSGASLDSGSSSRGEESIDEGEE